MSESNFALKDHLMPGRVLYFMPEMGPSQVAATVYTPTMLLGIRARPSRLAVYVLASPVRLLVSVT